MRQIKWQWKKMLIYKVPYKHQHQQQLPKLYTTNQTMNKEEETKKGRFCRFRLIITQFWHVNLMNAYTCGMDSIWMETHRMEYRVIEFNLQICSLKLNWLKFAENCTSQINIRNHLHIVNEEKMCTILWDVTIRTWIFTIMKIIVWPIYPNQILTMKYFTTWQQHTKNLRKKHDIWAVCSEIAENRSRGQRNIRMLLPF